MGYLSPNAKRIKDTLAQFGIKRSEISTKTHSVRRHYEDGQGKKRSFMEPMYVVGHLGSREHTQLVADNAETIAANDLHVCVITHQCGHMITAWITTEGSKDGTVERRAMTSTNCRECKVAALEESPATTPAEIEQGEGEETPAPVDRLAELAEMVPVLAATVARVKAAQESAPVDDAADDILTWFEAYLTPATEEERPYPTVGETIHTKAPGFTGGNVAATITGETVVPADPTDKHPRAGRIWVITYSDHRCTWYGIVHGRVPGAPTTYDTPAPVRWFTVEQYAIDAAASLLSDIKRQRHTISDGGPKTLLFLHEEGNGRLFRVIGPMSTGVVWRETAGWSAIAQLGSGRKLLKQDGQLRPDAQGFSCLARPEHAAEMLAEYWSLPADAVSFSFADA
ncbi:MULTISPECIES: hypothetical protein [Streptosporangium]|uniref:Uncharacterized protein n=1 Tax=Streptosporangium brasiliense TaxID=47480 RepID=A0ABT9RM57_9ACTN|nr:hypothetical protein [Streptosporangium brasiliense]MDP9870378.1 hypothetical protein [Streptosporangium brasiliense]